MPLSALHVEHLKRSRSPATRVLSLSAPFAMHRGGALTELELAYECWGALAPARDNVVLLFTGLSPSAHAAASREDPEPGWWEWMIGPGRPIDTRRFHVLCVNSLGSCFGSSGPASLNPHTKSPYGLSFPELSIEDIARSAGLLLDALGIERVHTVLGASMGGMSALAFAQAFPARAERLGVISGAAQASPFAIAMRSMQREIVRNDPAWRGGDYAPGVGPIAGMRMARKLGVSTYRSPDEWNQRFGRRRVDERVHDAFAPEFEVEAYLEYHARKFTGHFDANCYLYLSRAMDWFELDTGETPPWSALALKRALVVGVRSDVLFPLAQQREIAKGLREAGCEVDFHALDSIQGHDAFLVDKERFAPVMRAFFEGR